MGTEERGPLGGPSLSTSLLEAMLSTEWQWTELELRGLCIYTQAHVDMLNLLVRRTTKLKQINLIDFDLSPELCQSPCCLDGLLEAAAGLCTLDELRLCRRAELGTFVTNLVSPEAWQSLLTQKPKWWRLAMDGMGLDDRHAHVLAEALRSSTQCKVGDLLSLRNNPNLSDYKSIMDVCFCKQRMGEVTVDDPQWVATFHVVRSMNNLHRRLEYVVPETGGYPSRDRWIEWLSVLGNIGWQDDAHQVNYLWFTLLEQPNFVSPLTKPKEVWH